MSSESELRGYLKQFSKSKSGMIGLVMLVFLIGLSLYVLVSFPPDIALTWNNPKNWQGNPAHSPPTWVSYLGYDLAPTIDFPASSWANAAPAGSGVYNYSNSFSFHWSSAKPPGDTNLILRSNDSVLEAVVTWVKPDGNSLAIYVANPTIAYQYGVGDPGETSWILQYMSSQTGTPIATATQAEEVGALFNQDGPNLLTNPVLQGTYHVRIDIISNKPVTISPNTSFIVSGQSFGAMGTDLFGRPIELGILLGVPWALELGAVTAVVAVLFGIIFGGIAGFVGGNKDGVMQWITLVALALPALPFLIALSYSITLDLVTEALLIAALSWPFYAIIARSVALSVKSQTYVEADKAMGISSIRTFFTHFMPRLTPVSIAYTALGVPAGILLAQTLAFLGIQPSTVVTWGGLLNDAFVQQAALFGWWWWVLFPGLMIVVASIPFVLVGFTLDKIVAPRVSAK